MLRYSLVTTKNLYFLHDYSLLLHGIKILIVHCLPSDKLSTMVESSDVKVGVFTTEQCQHLLKNKYIILIGDSGQ